MGLLVVSSKLGGVGEVLPENMVIYSECTPESFITAMNQAIKIAY